MNARVNVCPALKMPESHRPVSLVLECGEPTQVQVTVSFTLMVAVFGENAKLTMFILVLAPRAGSDQLTAATARPQRKEWNNRSPGFRLFIFLIVFVWFGGFGFGLDTRMGANVNDTFSPETGSPYADVETGAAPDAPKRLDVNADGWSVLQSLPVSVSV